MKTELRAAAKTAEPSASMSDFDESDGKWEFSGLAVGAGDILHAPDGTEVVFKEEHLRRAAASQAEERISVDHPKDDEGNFLYPPPVEETVGTVDGAGYVTDPETGVAGVGYNAVTHDPDIARGVYAGSYDVSVHPFFEAEEEDPETGALVAKNIRFGDLSVVSHGDSPSNTVRWGPGPQQLAAMHRRVDMKTELAAAGSDVHEPTYSGTSEAEWERPTESDFETDDLGDIGENFVASETGFPPENYGDLHLPVVEPESGNLNRTALQVAKGQAPQVSGISADNIRQAQSTVDSIANEEFPDADFGANESTASLFQRLGSRMGFFEAAASGEQDGDEPADTGETADGGAEVGNMTDEDTEPETSEEETGTEEEEEQTETETESNTVEVDLGDHESLSDLIDERVGQQVAASREEREKGEKVDEIIALDEEWDEDNRDELMASGDTVVDRIHNDVVGSNAATLPGSMGGHELTASLGGGSEEDEDADDYGTGVGSV